MKKINNTFRAGLAMAAGIVVMSACTDTWNDHYDAAPQLKFNGTAMQALEEKAPDFAKVVKAYGFDKELSSGNTYTVWAPADGTFELSAYINAAGERAQDSAEVVNEFIKNHVARYSWSLNGEDQTFNLMNEKVGKMTANGMFGASTIDAAEDKRNVACTNGILYIISEPNPYATNLLEKIRDLYRLDTSYEDKAECSLYAYLYDPINNADTLIESKSVNRGMDENGEKIWVYRYMEPNNTPLKNVDARLYEEDSSFIAIIPTAKAWSDRYKVAEQLLKFNPLLDKAVDDPSQSVCDSLTRHYANMFCMTDLFYNKKANEHLEDSLKSTNYRLYGAPWTEHVYYKTMPETLPEDKELNDILSKCGESMECSNGTAYEVSEYPMSIYEQFFKKIKVTAYNSTINNLKDSKGVSTLYTTNLPETFYTHGGRWTWTLIWYADEEMTEEVSRETRYWDLTYVPCTPKASGDIQVALNVGNTLSGTYDIFVVTVPIWKKTYYNDMPEEDLNLRGYKFSANIIERLNANDTENADSVGQFPEKVTSAMAMINPNPTIPEDPTLFTTPYNRFRGEDYFPVVSDTTYLGQWTFKNAYYGGYGGLDYGVILQLSTHVELDDRNTYSTEMLISSVILKPHDPEKPVQQQVPQASKRNVAAQQKKNFKLITSNTRN